MNPTNMMPAPNQQPSPDQPFPLPTERWQQIWHTFILPWHCCEGTERHAHSATLILYDQPCRVKSSIPNPNTGQTWVYPSQQMFWNAMKRKGVFEFQTLHLKTSSSDRLAMGTWGYISQRHGPHHQGWFVVKHLKLSFAQIHNTNNENAWGEVLKWERFHKAECPEPQVKAICAYESFILTLILSVEKLWRQGQRLFTKSKTERNAWISDAIWQVSIVSYNIGY